MTYNTAPLPFQGQKRNFVSKFKEVLKDFPDNAIYVDLFGGSGLLSHTIKAEKPDATVIYNDFDNYRQRLDNISGTNNLIEDIKPIINIVEKKGKVPLEVKKRIIDRIEKESHFVDYLTLSTALLFSGNYALNLEDLKKQTFYNRILKGGYSADGYLNGVERVSKDYKQLLETYKDCENVIFILDPPYLSTDVTTYSNENYWRLKDYLNILTEIQDSRYIYFTSNKSQIVELCDWLFEYCHKSPFEDTTITTTNNTVRYNVGYTDIMVVKK